MSREPTWTGDPYDLAAGTSPARNGRAPLDPGPLDPGAWDDLMQRDGPLPATSWTPIDLGPYLRGEVVRAQPTIGLARSDNLRLLYPGKEHAVIGEMECGKSWYSCACVAAELLTGRHVVYVHFEEADPGDTIERLLALGVPAAVMLTQLRFVGPDTPVTPPVLTALLEPSPSLVVFDGVVEAMVLHSQENRDETGAATYRRRLVKPCTRVGAAVLSADHVVKDPERRGRGAIGSVHKGNGLSGALILLENAEPFGRGARGRSHVYITKDRPGHLRRHGTPDKKVPGRTYLGELVVDDTQTRAPDLDLKFWAPRPDTADDATDQAPTADDQVVTAVRQLATAGHTVNLRAVRAASGLRKSATDDAIERLLIAGRLTEQQGARGARIFTSAPEDRAP